MNEEYAREILSWRYEAPLDFYNPRDFMLQYDIMRLTLPSNLYWAVFDEAGSLVAYFCFGTDSRVSGYEYEDNALDVGLGARPDLVGTGIGNTLMNVALDFAGVFLAPDKFRATVAAFNDRALKICKKAGFEQETTFTDENGAEFVVFTKANEGAIKE